MAIYTNLKDIKRVIRSSDNEIVRFSDSLSSITIRKDRSTRGSQIEFTNEMDIPALGFNELEIEVDPDFDSKLNLHIRFVSPTEFNVYKLGLERKFPRLLSQGADINSDYTTPDGLLTIKSEAWFGVIETGDIVELTFDPHISDNDVLKYIEDTEVEIDAMLTSLGVDILKEGETRLFDPSAVPPRPIPPQIQVAATYLTAYYLFTDLFVRIYKQTDPDFTYSGRWKKRAENYINNYIKEKGLVPPRAMAFPMFIDKAGVEGVGPGSSKMVEDMDEINRDAQTDFIFDPDLCRFRH